MTGECPFCDKALSSQRTLRDHVMRTHNGVAVAGGRFSFQATEVYSFQNLGATWNIRCWCGSWYYTKGAILSHWHARGGLHAHLLEIALGRQQ